MSEHAQTLLEIGLASLLQLITLGFFLGKLTTKVDLLWHLMVNKFEILDSRFGIPNGHSRYSPTKSKPPIRDE